MITGYNTDVEHKGVLYHVQTEDKGLKKPIILSLVYTGGEILASKRSPYDDLIASGFDKEVLTERLTRQHKLICAAVHAGRIDDLKRLSQHDQTLESTAHGPSQADRVGVAAESSDRFSIVESGKREDSLEISLLDEKPLRAGESVTLRIQVTRNATGKSQPAAKASVTLKTLGSQFQSSSTFSTTDSTGRSVISLVLPMFSSGRAAILIRVETDGDVAELRRIIQPG